MSSLTRPQVEIQILVVSASLSLVGSLGSSRMGSTLRGVYRPDSLAHLEPMARVIEGSAAKKEALSHLEMSHGQSSSCESSS